MQGARYWLALGRIPGIGKVVYKTLIERFGSPEGAFRASLQELVGIKGLKRDVALAIKGFKDWGWVGKELELVKRHGVRLLTLKDKGYPKNLLAIYDPPPYLYIKGNIEEADEVAVAIVGSRLPTPYGIAVTERIAGDLASSGVTVVSGMARGCDTAAHRGALRAGGRTIAILGCGVDVIYPKENKRLYEEIGRRGALVSELPMGTTPYPTNFPVRNRIIMGLSLGVVVVEAAPRSGSLITARLALDAGREVFAVPGSITSYKSRGTNNLLKQGAKLVEDARDILEELSPAIPSKRRTRVVDASPRMLSSQEERILQVLEDEPLFIDTIIQRSGLLTQEVLSLLLALELKGLIQQQPGRFFLKRCPNPLS